MKGICGEWFSARFFETFLHIPIHSEAALGLRNETACSVGKPTLKASGLKSEDAVQSSSRKSGRERLGEHLSPSLSLHWGPGGRREYSRLASISPCVGTLGNMLGLSSCPANNIWNTSALHASSLV